MCACERCACEHCAYDHCALARANRVFRADEKRIRTQSAILDKTRVGLVVDPSRPYCGLMPAVLMMRA